MTDQARLLPEWYPQEAILLSWPDAQTDWANWLSEVQNTYIDIISAINRHSCPVILLVRQEQIPLVESMLPASSNVLLVPADYNDTWLRDYGFLTCQFDSAMYPVSFCFNGWGDKFDANKDNRVNSSYLAELCQHSLVEHDLVLEGGALEINDEGILLSTELCLSNPKRNGALDLRSYQQAFAKTLGATNSLILQNGHLEGDDTDGHIDTLVRFTPENNVVIQTAYNRPDDPHFAGLNALVEECRKRLTEATAREPVIFQLPLPFIQNSEGDRLPASYANFLISNQQIFAPIYDQPEDQAALETLAKAYPQFNIVPINCHALVQQYGSLHCISMQIPKGTLKPEFIQKAQSGVSVYASR